MPASRGRGGIRSDARLHTEPPILGSEEAELEIFKRISEIGFDPRHPTAAELMKPLAEYGTGVLVGMSIKGTLFTKCERLGLRDLSTPPPSWRSEGSQIIALATLEACPGFIENSLRKWKPEGGAALGTWFVNYVLLYKFRSHFERHCREWGKRGKEVPLDDALLISRPGFGNDPERLAIVRAALRKVFASDPLLAQIVQLMVDGLSSVKLP
jgi:hypothetical protein